MRSLTFIMQLLICSIVVLFFDICLAADTIESAQQVIANATQIKKIDTSSREMIYIESNDELVVTGSKSTSNKSYYNVTCYDMTGTVLWEKQAFLLNGIFIGQNSDKIVLAKLDENQEENAIYTCYDRSGNELWTRTINRTSFAISDNGKYGITMKSNVEGGGRFQVFDMQTGIEIPVTILKDYSYFFATFLNNHQAVVLLQKVYKETDKEHVRIYDQKIKELYDKARQTAKSNRYKIDRDELRRLQEERDKGIKIKYQPVKYLVYDIESHSVVFEKNIIANDGSSLRCSRGWTDIIDVNPAGNTIAMQLVFEDLTPGEIPLALYIMTIQGEELYFDKTVEKISSFKFIDNARLLVNHGNRARLFSLYNIQNHKTDWTFYDDGPGVSGEIKNINIFGNMLSFVYYSYMRYNINNFQLDLITGEKSGEPFGEHILCKITPGNIVLVNKEEHTLTFMQR